MALEKPATTQSPEEGGEQLVSMDAADANGGAHGGFDLSSQQQAGAYGVVAVTAAGPRPSATHPPLASGGATVSVNSPSSVATRQILAAIKEGADPLTPQVSLIIGLFWSAPDFFSPHAFLNQPPT